MSDRPNASVPVSISAGKAVRLAVFSADGRRSSTWAAWTSKRKLDAYIQNLAMRQSWKVSLHESGSWQHGLLKESKGAEALAIGQSRHWDIWASGAVSASSFLMRSCARFQRTPTTARPSGCLLRGLATLLSSNSYS